MIANEVMLECPLTLNPGMSVTEAIAVAKQSDLDVLPLVDHTGHYHGAISKPKPMDAAADAQALMSSLCCSDVITCAPDFAVEHLAHDATSSTPHRSIMVVDSDGTFRGVVPWMHWAVDEAKVQSGYPRNPLEVRTYSMHLTWRCTDCGELLTRNDGIPHECPACGAESSAFCLYTED